MAAVVTPPNLRPIKEGAPHVPCSPTSIATPAYRDRLKIPFYRIGGRLYVDLDEIAEWRARRREGGDAA